MDDIDRDLRCIDSAIYKKYAIFFGSFENTSFPISLPVSFMVHSPRVRVAVGCWSNIDQAITPNKSEITALVRAVCKISFLILIIQKGAM